MKRFLFIVFTACSLQAHAAKPNIIVIFTDDHGYADLSCAGLADDIETPALDGLIDAVPVNPATMGCGRAQRSGIDELLGNGWEWTATDFAPLPGFEPWIETYPGYSADFFDDQHFVMLGGSWATDLALVRRSFRNWFRPHYPYVFSKFRCVREA